MAIKTVFFGTPDFAVPSLQALIEDARYDVVAVVTQPDKPVGRKQVLQASPVKAVAVRAGIPVLQPPTLRLSQKAGADFLDQFSELAPDIAIVVAYGHIIPREVLDVPKHGCINVHGSLLPKLRGASPIQMAVVEGFEKTGVTIMLMDEGMDTGDMLRKAEIEIGPDTTAQTLHDEMMHVGAEALVDTVEGYIQGSIQPEKQDDADATYCGKITKEDGEIDWTKTAQEIDQLVRGFTPWPGTYTFCDGKRVKILTTHVAAGKLEVLEVQPEGKKAMSYDDYLRGNPDCPLPPT